MKNAILANPAIQQNKISATIQNANARMVKLLPTRIATLIVRPIAESVQQAMFALSAMCSSI